MKVAVIGAGWAGLSAAVELHRMGHEVTVFEAGHRLGGRARGVHSPKLDAQLDNGQHILLGAYTETLSLMTRLGLDTDKLLLRMPLALRAADGRFELNVPRLPNPLALPASLLGAKGITWQERFRLAAALARLSLRGWAVQEGLTVAEWLRRERQSPTLLRYVWEPLCIASMNTPIDRACAQLFANVLRDSLGAGPRACQVLIPRVDLSSLWPEDIPESIRVVRGHTVRHLTLRDAATERPLEKDTPHDTRCAGVCVDDQDFDAVIVATNVQSARRLLGRLPCRSDASAYLSTLDAFEPLPIATLTLELSGIWDMPQPMLMLTESPQTGRFGQWLFQCNAFLHAPLSASRLNIVISHAVSLAKWTTEEIVQGVIEQISETDLPRLPPVGAYELITEKRATFAAVPGLKRPGHVTPWPHVWVAGDWTDTGYPAVLEGAVRSGIAAARSVSQRATAG